MRKPLLPSVILLAAQPASHLLTFGAPHTLPKNRCTWEGRVVGGGASNVGMWRAGYAAKSR
jgi:hypothetical protein